MDDKKRRHKACSACSQRKVRCNGQQRCQQCEHLNLRCEYPEPAPRQIQRNRTPKKIQKHVRDHPVLAAAPHERECQSVGIDQEERGHHETSFFLALLPDFQNFVLPFHPVITIAEAQYAIETMGTDSEAEAFVFGLAAVTLNLTHSLRSQMSSPNSDIETWVSRSLNTLQPVLSQDDISVRRVATLQFIHVCLMGMGRHDLAFYYLRQSTTMVEILRIGDAEVMAQFSLAERARRQRLYWTVFVHERFYAITCQRPIVLPPLKTIFETDDTIPDSVAYGFIQIVRLFMHIDEDMVAKWLATFDSDQIIEPVWIIEKHRQLDAETAATGDDIAGLSSMQQADLVITRHWLRMLVWQMAMSKCLLSSGPSEQSMSLLFPVGVSGQLRNLIGNMTKDAIEVHGSGIQQKLFELTDTIASVVLTVPAASIEEKRQRSDDFRFLFEFWKSLPRPNPVQGELLEDKYRRLAEMGL